MTGISKATRKAVLAAAARSFGARGVRGATMDGIATDAGVSKPTIYAHFGSKAGLVDAVIKMAWERRDSTTWPSFQPSRGVEEQLVEILDRHVQHVLCEENMLLFRALLIDHTARGRMVAQLSDERPRRLAALLGDAALAGAFKPAPTTVESCAEWLCAMIDGRLLWPVVLGVTPPPSPRHRRACVLAAVRFVVKRSAQ